MSGELGGGKTQFVKGLAKGLLISEDITSPTFTYEKIYNGPKISLYHFDLYREEVLDQDIKLLIEEAIKDKNGVLAVEWADRLGDFKPSKYTSINFKWKGEHERELEIR